MDDKNSKEINLLQLLSLVFNWIASVTKKIITFVGKLLQLSVKHWVLFSTILLLCIALGQYMARPSARKHKAGGIAMLYGSDNYTVGEICRQLSNTFSDNKNLSLSAKLGIPDSISKNIVTIASYNVIDYLKDETPDKIDFTRKHSLTDTLNLVMKDRIYLEIVTRNVNQVKTFQDAFLKYLNSNTVLKTKFETEKINLQNRIKVCDSEIKRIDSLAKVSYFKDTNKEISFNNNKLTVGEQRKQLFYDDMIRLNDIKAYSSEKIATYVQPVDFPSDMVVNSIAINNRITYGMKSFIIGTLLAFLMVFLLDNSKKIISFLKNEKK